jgi:hypothetical protein
MKSEFLKGNNQFPNIETALDRLNVRCRSVNGTARVFSCLRLLDDETTDAVAVYNPNVISQMMLLDRTSSSYYLGFSRDGSVASRAVFSGKKHRGNDHALLNDAYGLIFKSIPTMDAFIRRFNHFNSTSHA